jgi:predicted DNA-binding transcriptional regulator YafY
VVFEESDRQLRRGPEQRLEFIEYRLFWEGAVNRSDLMERFGVSVPQASNDLTMYRQRAPENVTYDLSGKRYVPTAVFQPKFLKPNPDRYLAQLKAMSDGILDRADTWLSSQPDTGVLPIPTRRTDPTVLRAILAAVRGQCGVHVEYQSTSPENPDPIWRWISPHAFAFDGLRWHVRAFCHRDNRFKDFIIGRCLAAGEQGPAAASAGSDWQWQTFFEVILRPNPDLTESQRRAVALDYNMSDGRVAVPVRFALLYYFYKRLRLDVAEYFDKPRERPVVVANRKRFEAALEKADVPLSTSERVSKSPTLQRMTARPQVGRGRRQRQ